MAFYRGVYEGEIDEKGKMAYEEPFAYDGLIRYSGRYRNFVLSDSLSGQEKNFSLDQIKTMAGDVGRYNIEKIPGKELGKEISTTNDYIGKIIISPGEGIVRLESAGDGLRIFSIDEISSIKEIDIYKATSIPQKRAFQKRL